MANDGQIVFEVTADGKHAIADIKEITKLIQKETGKWDDAAKQSTDNIGNSFSGLLKKLTLGFGAAKIGKVLLDIGKDAIQAASDLEEVQNVVDVTFGDGANKIDAWAKNASKQFGLTETQAKRFTSTLGAMMKSSGLAGDEIVGMSTDLAGLAADMASFYNLDFDTAFQKIRSGISGETEPLKQLGINMSVANLNAFALQQGLKKTFEQMTQGEQTMLRYQYLMQATSDAQGDFARTSDGYANQVRLLQTNVDKLKESLGVQFIKVVSDATGLINDFVESLAPKVKEKTVLDEFAEIDLKADEKIAKIRETAGEARLLTEQLDAIGGSKADKAGSKVQQIAEGLSTIDLQQDKTKVVTDFISTLADNIDILAAIQGTDAEGARQWLANLASGANELNSDDAEGWAKLIESIKTGLPGIENTDFGAGLFAALGGGFSDVEQKTSVLEWAVETLGNKTNKTAQEQAVWLETCKRLVQTIPGLSSIINTETGEIKGGTQAVKDYIKAWEDGQTKLAMISALQEKETALSQKFSNLPGLQLDAAMAERRVRKYREKMDALAEKYGISNGYNEMFTYTINEVSGQIDPLTDWQEQWNEYVRGLSEIEKASQDATDKYKEQEKALEEAKIALEEYRQTISEMPGDVEAATAATDNFWTENEENIKTLVNAAKEATSELAEYYSAVHDRVLSAINSTTDGFGFLGDAAQRQAKRLEPLNNELKTLEENGEDLTDINLRISNAQDMFGIGNLRKNLESQLAFLREYKSDMEAARAAGFSDEFLAQFADGSVESAEWLHELTNASSSEVTELNNLYAQVTEGKNELADTLTQQQLSVDDVYRSLADKAKEAVAELDMSQQAADNTGKTVDAVVSELASNVPAVAEQVDAILSQLNRLNGYGINIDFGGFGSISFTTSTGENAEGSGRYGLDFIPHDNYLARLHEGERVLTAQENQIWNSLLNGGVSGFSLDDLGGVMRDNIHAGGNVYLDGKTVGSVISDRQGRSYKTLQRSGWQQ